MDDAAEAPDFSRLPLDALLNVFDHLFAPPAGDVAVALSEVHRLWQNVRLTCKALNEALLAHPPPLYLDIAAVPRHWIPWLAGLPIRVLRIEAGLDPCWTAPPTDDSDGADDHPRQRGPAGTPAPLSALQLVEAISAPGRAIWPVGEMAQLQQLHLQAPVSGPPDREPLRFDSERLRGLRQLRHLSLGSFADFSLEHLPASLRRLRLAYDGQSRVLSVPCLPDHITRLDWLRLEKPGALGVCLDDVWGRVAQLEVHAREALLGVPVDRRLAATFERPYREGNFVPPHIWGDEEADEDSKQAAELAANQLLCTLLPDCPRLQRLCLGGGAAASLKFMPVLPHARHSLQWLWSVVRMQGLHNLWGLSGAELEARQELFEGRLSVERGQDHVVLLPLRSDGC